MEIKLQQNLGDIAGVENSIGIRRTTNEINYEGLDELFAEPQNNNLIVCPITQEPIINKLTLYCGHMFEQSSILEWILNNENDEGDSTCPVCRNIIVYNRRNVQSPHLWRSLIAGTAQQINDSFIGRQAAPQQMNDDAFTQAETFFIKSKLASFMSHYGLNIFMEIYGSPDKMNNSRPECFFQLCNENLNSRNQCYPFNKDKQQAIYIKLSNLRRWINCIDYEQELLLNRESQDRMRDFFAEVLGMIEKYKKDVIDDF